MRLAMELNVEKKSMMAACVAVSEAHELCVEIVNQNPTAIPSIGSNLALYERTDRACPHMYLPPAQTIVVVSP